MKHLSAICQKTLSVPGAKLCVGFSQGAPVQPPAPSCSWHSSSSPRLPKPDVFMWRHWPDWQELLARHRANAACNSAQCQLWYPSFRYSEVLLGLVLWLLPRNWRQWWFQGSEIGSSALSVCSLQVLVVLINAQFSCSQRSEHSYWPKLAVDALTELLQREKFLDSVYRRKADIECSG